MSVSYLLDLRSCDESGCGQVLRGSMTLSLPRPGPLGTFPWLFQEDGAVDQLRWSVLQKWGLNLVGFWHFHSAQGKVMFELLSHRVVKI